jgi:ribosomal protein L40E
MMRDALQSLICSQCGGGPLTNGGHGTVSCPYCGSTFAHPDRVCKCGTVNEQDAHACVACGERLQEPCVRCGTFNGLRATHCRQCGSALNILEHIAARRAQTEADRRYNLQAEATRVKEEDEQAAQRRMDEMWAVEHKRLETLAKNKAEQQRQERLIWMIAAVAIIALVVCIVALALSAQLRMH